MKRKKRYQDNANSAMMPAGNAAIQRKANANGVMHIPHEPLVQRKTGAQGPADYDDEHMRLKPIGNSITPYIQAKGAEGIKASDAISGKIKATKGSGDPMSGNTKSFMENRFGNDFSNVKIHTGNDAAQLSGALNAQAFTVGNDIYFNSNKYAPQTSDGKRLLAHELTHVLQQNENGQKVQRAKIEGTLNKNPGYVLNGKTQKQEQEPGSSRFQSVRLTYDTDYDMFFATFSVTFVFPNNWDDTRRNTYAYDFEDAVRRVWDNKYRLQETVGEKRNASVSILFDNEIQHQNDTNMAPVTNTRSPWVINSDEKIDRSEVSSRFVKLETVANKDRSMKGKEIRDRAKFSMDNGSDKKTFTQNTSAHEFGHMIGLNDEYLNDDDTPVKDIDPARAFVTNRIMNSGNEVTPDVYKPFADWLSGLTNTKWVVGARVIN